MKLKTKMFIGSAVLAVLPVIVTALFIGNTASNLGQEALRENVKNHLTAIRDNKKAQIETYFEHITEQLVVFADSKSIKEAMHDFKESFFNFKHEALQFEEVAHPSAGPPLPQFLPIDNYREALEIYYNEDFTEEYNRYNVDTISDMTAILNQLEDNSVALQYFYISDNPNSLGTKEELSSAQDSSSYTRYHRFYHPYIKKFQQRFNFQDIFLVDIETGYIVYSVLKELDFATSLAHGPYAKTNIGSIFQQVTQAKRDEVFLVDFSPYLPSYNSQAAFIGVPIFDGSEKIGAVIFQIPITEINDIMTYNGAWQLDESGYTGEAYIVAADNGTMRSDSRMIVEDKAGYLKAIQDEAVAQDIIKKIERRDTTVGLQNVSNRGVESASAGITGFAQYENYLGNIVLSAYTPINISGLSWILFSEINAQESSERLEQLSGEITYRSLPFALGILIIGGVLGLVVFGRIVSPISHLEATVSKVAEGDYTARSDVKTKDELGMLSIALNSLLDDRLSQLAKAERETEMLNNSVIELLKASFQLSQRDLTVRVPVTEDVTGPLADAINQMATETSKVLLNVRRITDQVELASSRVKSQGDNVCKVAESEREVVDTTMAELSAAAEAMNKIAEVAQSCNEIAAQATRTIQIALATVTSTVQGMSEIRETIHETEKRIKRLGERSQEISSIIDIINNIAERTHVLALNASMQAAAAGEAGRGFSVVADEVQRLAESSRNATSQISALVKNIQVETNDTIATMDKTITQVVEGSRLAERAGEQMKETQNTTANLVQVVEQIAMASRQQAQISNELRERAQTIQHSTQETAKQLEEQTVQTDRLVEYAKQLIESVRVFKLSDTV